MSSNFIFYILKKILGPLWAVYVFSYVYDVEAFRFTLDFLEILWWQRQDSVSDDQRQNGLWSSVKKPVEVAEAEVTYKTDFTQILKNRSVLKGMRLEPVL